LLLEIYGTGSQFERMKTEMVLLLGPVRSQAALPPGSSQRIGHHLRAHYSRSVVRGSLVVELKAWMVE
jgi:hypothetical protein